MTPDERFWSKVDAFGVIREFSGLNGCPLWHGGRACRVCDRAYQKNRKVTA